MRFDITRQPLSFVMVQFFLLSMLFLYRVELFPAVAETINMSAGFALGGVFDAWMVQLGLWGHLLTMFVVFVNAMLITRVVTRNMVLGMRTYIPSLIYLMISCGVFIPLGISGYIVSFLVIYGSDYFIQGFRRAHSFDFMFRGGMMIGMAVLFCFEMVFGFVALVVALVLFRRTMREAIVGFVGFVLPLATCSYVYWGMGHDFSYVATWGWSSLEWMQHYGAVVSAIGIPQLVFISVTILIVFLALGAFVINVRNMRNRAYRIFIYFIWLMLIGVILFVLPFSSSIGYSVVAIATAVIAPYFFVRHSNWISLTLYSLLFVSVIIVNVLPIIVP